MDTTFNTQETAQATVNSNMASALTVADSSSAQRVQQLGLVHQARLAQLTRTAASVTAQYGADSMQAAAATAAVTSSRLLVARISQINLRVTLAAPTVAAGGWALYGHIYTSTGAAAVAYTVFLVDEQNAYQGAVGFSYTGSDGSYALNYQPAAGAGALPQLYLQVANASAQPVYLSTVVFAPAVGQASYQDVTLPAGEPVLGDPPAEIRATALPDVKATPTKKRQG
jgi:hypothetical protein